MLKWCQWHMQTAKAQTRLHIHAVWSKPFCSSTTCIDHKEFTNTQDFRLNLAYTGRIGRTGVNFSKVPRVISNSINTAQGHSSLPDYCAERDHNNDSVTDKQ